MTSPTRPRGPQPPGQPFVLTWLKAKHPGLRGGYLWESGREGTSEWASQVGALLMK